MAMKARRRTCKVPDVWRQTLHFANARVTPDNWRSVLLKLQGIQPMPDKPLFGFRTVAELEPVLVEFRAVLGRLACFDSVDAAQGSDLLQLLNARAKGVLKKWIWDRGTGRVFPYFDTENQSFEEALYASLLVAMSVEPFTNVKQCRECARFFYEPHRVVAALCSANCRTRAARTRVERYRREHADQYREYQRGLMAKRRRQGTA